MSEHLLIGDIATLLIVLGLTGPLLAPVLAIPEQEDGHDRHDGSKVSEGARED